MVMLSVAWRAVGAIPVDACRAPMITTGQSAAGPARSDPGTVTVGGIGTKVAVTVTVTAHYNYDPPDPGRCWRRGCRLHRPGSSAPTRPGDR